MRQEVRSRIKIGQQDFREINAGSRGALASPVLKNRTSLLGRFTTSPKTGA